MYILAPLPPPVPPRTNICLNFNMFQGIKKFLEKRVSPPREEWQACSYRSIDKHIWVMVHYSQGVEGAPQIANYTRKPTDKKTAPSRQYWVCNVYIFGKSCHVSQSALIAGWVSWAIISLCKCQPCKITNQ